MITATVLFTDLVGFTEYTDVVGDVAAVDLLDQQTSITISVVPTYGGRIVKELGDGLMIWFGSPCEGLAGAVSLMAAIETARADGAFPLAIRMGLHHGEAIRRDDDLVGQTINIAARIAALAGPGELLVSEIVVDACDAPMSSLQLNAVGPVVVKGVKDPVWLQRASGLPPDIN